MIYKRKWSGDYINIAVQEVLDRLDCFPAVPYNYFVVGDQRYLISNLIGDRFLSDLCSDIDDCYSLVSKFKVKGDGPFERFDNFNEKLDEDEEFKLEVIDYICESFKLNAENEELRYLVPNPTDTDCTDFTVVWRCDDAWYGMDFSLVSILKCIHANF
nr:MAG TPA: hypothetical protein [Caudoviricetes sp.]